jgi:phage shock protein PspC (stress-responsive transcriptional regulator)
VNEVTRIHLARTTYEIDAAAKKELEAYLAAIKKSLPDDEIMDDIELRMTEILYERGVKRDDVITVSDVTAMRQRLGEPRDFKADSQTDDSEDWRDNLFTRGRENPTKRFYRDEDNALLGGVIAGLAAYTGWDVTLLRILAVILTVFPFWGMPIIIYVLVWIITPAARTTAEKLEMHGEPVTLENLKNSEFVVAARDRFDEFKERGKKVKDEVKTEIQDEIQAEKAEAKTFAAEAKAKSKTFAAEVKADAKAYTAEAKQRWDNLPRRRVSPVAAIFGVVFFVIGFATLAAAIVMSLGWFVLLINNDFASEPWLWLTGGSMAVAMFTLAGLFIVAGNGLMNSRKRPCLAKGIAGTLGTAIMFSIFTSIFIAIWVWSIPKDYNLPTEVIHTLQRLDENICRVDIKPYSLEVYRHCDD